VATLEQVRIGIRGALAEYFESFYGIWYYPEKFWGSEYLQDIPYPSLVVIYLEVFLSLISLQLTL